MCGFHCVHVEQVELKARVFPGKRAAQPRASSEHPETGEKVVSTLERHIPQYRVGVNGIG